MLSLRSLWVPAIAVLSLRSSLWVLAVAALSLRSSLWVLAIAKDPPSDRLPCDRLPPCLACTLLGRLSACGSDCVKAPSDWIDCNCMSNARVVSLLGRLPGLPAVRLRRPKKEEVLFDCPATEALVSSCFDLLLVLVLVLVGLFVLPRHVPVVCSVTSVSHSNSGEFPFEIQDMMSSIVDEIRLSNVQQGRRSLF
jgi:hypothetical protein